MDEGALAVHEIELVVDARENLRDRRAVADHAACAHDLGEVAAGDDSWGLVVDTALEPGGAPIHELDGPLGLDGRHSRIHILGNDIAAVHHAAGLSGTRKLPSRFFIVS